MDADLIVVGGGVVGTALAYGAAKAGLSVLILDGEDSDLRAARANFGLVWVQGKGSNMPSYSELSLTSSDLWPSFRENLVADAGGTIDYARQGGFVYCLGEAEYEARSALNTRMHNLHSGVETEMIGRKDLDRMVPSVRFGPDVVGASYCRQDGHVNPLQLLSALQRAVVARGGRIIFRSSVSGIRPKSRGFAVHSRERHFEAERVIVAAGLSTSKLTEPLGLSMPLHSERGQLLVTERMVPSLPFPGSGLRQTADGTIMIGATKEDASDRNVTVASASKLAARAVRIIPALAQATLVRQWSGFRVMPPDGAPIYAQSSAFPGLFAAACHSGITLAAAHAEIVAPAMMAGQLATELPTFSNERFNVQKCA